MFVDALLTLSDAQALTATAVSTNTIDLGNVTPKRDVGEGEKLELVTSIDVALAGTTPTLAIEIIQSANADLSAPDVLGSRSPAAADVIAGAQFRVPVPPGAVTKRYLGARYTLGGTTPTVTLSSVIQPADMVSAPKPIAYADAITIS